MASKINKTISERDALIKVASLPWYWAMKSGGETSATATEVRNGGARTVEVIAGHQTISNITIERPFNPLRDLELARALKRGVGSRIDTITTQYTDANGQTIGKPVVDFGCLLVRVAWPKYDVNSNNAGMWQLEYKPQAET